MSTSFYPPYLLARVASTVDSIAEGRFGWNIVSSAEAKFTGRPAALVRHNRLADLIPHPHHGVERVHGPLRNKRDISPAHLAQFGFVQPGQVCSIQNNLAVNDPARRDVALQRVQEPDEVLMAVARHVLAKTSPARTLIAGELSVRSAIGIGILLLILLPMLVGGIVNELLINVALFILMGSFATVAAITTDLFRAAYVWLGNLRGGLAMATVLSSAAFGAASGSTIVNAAVFTRMAMPEMTRFGYDVRLSAGSIAAAMAIQSNNSRTPPMIARRPGGRRLSCPAASQSRSADARSPLPGASVRAP